MFLAYIESLLYSNGTDDYGKYVTMALKLEPEGVDQLDRKGTIVQSL